MTKAVPESGQLVEVRRRQWVVTDVETSSLSAANGSVSQHLVTLTSLDEDALNETLMVVWELEPGACILKTAGLPKIDGWDSCEHLEAFLDAIRWGAATNADRSFLQAPFRSGVEIQDYQLDPLVRAIDMARVSLLIADDVGLGKTIEAGLVVQELLIRYRARSVFIVCPASLQMKWQNEMHEKFGLEFRIVDTEYIKRLRRGSGIYANPWTSYPRLIASMDWMKCGEGLHMLKDALPTHVSYPRKFDILIVDEAHNVAPSTASRYAMPSQRTRLIRMLSPHFEHRLFLTATPSNGDPLSFTSLLEMLDNQRFARGMMPDDRLKQRVMVRRLKTDLVDEKGNPIYPSRELLPLEVDYTQEEREIHRLLKEFAISRAKSVKGTSAAFGNDFIHKLLKKRLFSSPRAFALTLAKHRQSLARGRSKRESHKMQERILHKAILRAEEDYADDAGVENAQEEAIEAATDLTNPLTASERSMLDRLSQWAETAKNRADSKATAILAWLDSHLKTDGEWNGKRVILFTEYRATHSWLMEILASQDWGGERLMTFHGGTEREERDSIRAAFQAHPDISPVRILLATDAASEGIDLQNHCNYLLHVEIPWNPNVMEQRNGRIDRHGQKERQVYIWHPVGKGLKSGIATSETKPGDLDGDYEFLMRAVRKVENIRQDLGCVGSVIAQQIEEAMLGRRMVMDTREVEAKALKARSFLSVERKIQERIARLHERLLESRESLHLTPDRVQRAVSAAMEIAEKPRLEPIPLTNVPNVSVYKVPLLTGSWDQATHGLAHPYTGARRPITFDHTVAQSRDDVVLAHLQHRLVQLSLRLLRAEVWAHDDRQKLKRVAIRTLPEGISDQPVVIVWSRLVITGGIHHRLHEELTFAGGELKPSGFARIRTLGKLEELLNVASPVEPSNQLFNILQTRFRVNETPILKAVEARSSERLAYLKNTLDRRRQAEETDMAQVLDELATMIKNELAESAKETQLEFWPGEQREQRRRDIQDLQVRLERIPAECDQEVAAIRRRYYDPTDRTFPIAVEFLVPERFKEGN